MTRPRGRPPRGQATPGPDEIVSAALDLLDSGGPTALTMRALADRLGVNPMTIYHHVGSREGVVQAMAGHVLTDVCAPESGPPLDRIAGLMRAYHGAVIRHPGLTLLIFGQTLGLPRQAQRISDDLRALLQDAGLTAARAALWADILVDHTHGAALAEGLGPGAHPDDSHAAGLGELLSAIARCK